MALPFVCPVCDTPGCYWFPQSGTVCMNPNCVHGINLAAEYKQMDEEAEKKKLDEIWNKDNLGLGSGLDCDCMAPMGWDCGKQGCHLREHGLGSGLDCSCGYPLCCCKGCFP